MKGGKTSIKDGHIGGGGLNNIFCLQGPIVCPPVARDRGEEGGRTHRTSQCNQDQHQGLMMVLQDEGTDRILTAGDTETCLQTMSHSSLINNLPSVIQYRDNLSMMDNAAKTNPSMTINTQFNS